MTSGNYHIPNGIDGINIVGISTATDEFDASDPFKAGPRVGGAYTIPPPFEARRQLESYAAQASVSPARKASRPKEG